jgi:hypothetical protein
MVTNFWMWVGCCKNLYLMKTDVRHLGVRKDPIRSLIIQKLHLFLRLRWWSRPSRSFWPHTRTEQAKIKGVSQVKVKKTFLKNQTNPKPKLCYYNLFIFWSDLLMVLVISFILFIFQLCFAYALIYDSISSYICNYDFDRSFRRPEREGGEWMGADKNSSRRRSQLQQDELGRIPKITRSALNLLFAKTT